jgi:hypothetical protein
MGAPGRSPERSQAVPFVAEETSQEKLLAHSRILHVEKRIGIEFLLESEHLDFMGSSPRSRFQEGFMAECSLTQWDASKNWPEGIISAKVTMNPYILAMAFEESLKRGMKLWELINLAVWQELGKPDRDALLAFAAEMEICDEDPKWKKRLKIAARHELAVEEFRRQQALEDLDSEVPSGDGRDKSLV